jgi:hypothetical protein
MNSETTYQLVLPVDYREVVLKGLYDDAGHQGRYDMSSVHQTRKRHKTHLNLGRYHQPTHQDSETSVCSQPKGN